MAKQLLDSADKPNFHLNLPFSGSPDMLSNCSSPANIPFPYSSPSSAATHNSCPPNVPIPMNSHSRASSLITNQLPYSTVPTYSMSPPIQSPQDPSSYAHLSRPNFSHTESKRQHTSLGSAMAVGLGVDLPDNNENLLNPFSSPPIYRKQHESQCTRCQEYEAEIKDLKVKLQKGISLYCSMHAFFSRNHISKNLHQRN